MKNILFIMSDLEGGGAEKALITLLQNFDYSKYRVTLCLLYHRGIYLNAIPPQVKVISLFKHERSFFCRKSRKRYLKHHKSDFLSLLIKCRIKRNYDVIISYMEGLSALFHSLVVDRGLKNISWIHLDMLNYHQSCQAFFDGENGERHCYQKMDQLVFVSRMAMDNFDKVYDVDVPKRYLYNVVNKEDIYKKASLNTVDRKAAFTITTIGSLFEVKGFDRLIRIAAMLKKDGFSFCVQIIGRGGKENELKQLAHELDVEAEIHFLGFQTNPYPYLKDSDIFISTSISEGLPLVICEALVLGIPVVATRTAGSIELLDNGKYGLLTEHDEDSIYEGVKRMACDEALREEYRKKSLARSAVFDIDESMKKIYELI